MRSLQIQCAGHGLGNASRILAIMEALRAREPDPARLRIEVTTWGNALSWLEPHRTKLGFGLTALEPFRPTPAGLPAYLRNSRKIAELTRKTRPDAALLDSDLHFFPLLRQRVSVYYLGQAHEVLRRARVWRLIPRTRAEWKSFLLFEALDAWIQRKVAREVLVPCAHPKQFPARPGLRPISLIVRQAFTHTPVSLAPKSAPLGMLLSGSGIEAERLTAWARKRGITPIPRSLKEDGAPAIDDFRAVIIQGGLSSISECIARRRAMIVVPIRDHYEQRVNAYEVEMQGLGGYRCPDLERDGDAAIDRLKISSFLFELPEAEVPSTNGAAEAAELLLSRLGTRAAP